MYTRIKLSTSMLSIALTVTVAAPYLSSAEQVQSRTIPYPDISEMRGSGARGAGPLNKLNPELRMLVDQYVRTSRGGGNRYFSPRQLREIFSIRPGEDNPSVGVAITLTPTASVTEIRNMGARVYFQTGSLVYADVSVRSIEVIAGQATVLSIASSKAASLPPMPEQKIAPVIELPERGAGGNRSAIVRPDNEFNTRGLTGKGTIIGIVDTGIDWKHQDFIRPDGTSRILYIWDLLDDSYSQSNRRIGSSPPILMENGSPGPGTIYTNEQINAALRGEGVVNTMDFNGHGTACAGTAAGNGRATANGVPAGSFKGVAPEADLIIVKAGECGGFDNKYIFGTVWIARIAKSLKRPVVINHSLGRHLSTHHGDDADENVMDWFSGVNKPGIAITAAAGNEASFSLHARGRFGPRRPGQADIQSSPIELVVSADRTEDVTIVNGYFDSGDEWGVAVIGADRFLVDKNGNSIICYIARVDGQLIAGLQKGVEKPDYFDDFAAAILNNSKLSDKKGGYDSLIIPLPPGTYRMVGFGATEKVRNGSFDFYLPDYRAASFTIGATKRDMVGSPGNAANVITVGAYDFRSSWVNRNNSLTIYNLSTGAISDYSNPGGPAIDGRYKPEIVAPATYTISSLSEAASITSTNCDGQNMASESGLNAITADGLHIAWSGTSAAAPFTAGVIALMFQKNPFLDAARIKNILIRTAIKGDRFVGAVPNPDWGYGKINPAAALAATPSGRPPVSRRVKR